MIIDYVVSNNRFIKSRTFFGNSSEYNLRNLFHYTKIVKSEIIHRPNIFPLTIPREYLRGLPTPFQSQLSRLT